MWNLERSDWIALVGSLAAGLVYGLLHAARVNAVLHDPFLPEPGFAAFEVFWLGVFVGAMVLLVVAALGVWLWRPRGLGCISGAYTAGLFAAGWVGACTLTMD